MSKLNVAYLDFDTIKASLRDYMRSQTAFKDYNFEAAGLTVLLNLLSYNTHYFGFYLNMIADEMFLDSAVLRTSVVSLAKQLGYTTGSVTAATGTVQITITPDNGAQAAVIEEGTLFSAAINNTTYNFVTNKAYGTTISNGQFIFPEVKLVQGLPYTFRYTVDSLVPDQRFILPSNQIDTSTLDVRVQNSIADTTLTSFARVDDILSIGPNSNVYYLQEVEDGKFQIYFGDGVLGKQLTDGNIVIADYILSNGSVANGATTFVPASTVAGYQKFLTRITTLAESAGGGDAQSIDEIKFSAPKNYETQGRAVTTSDYKFILEEKYPNIDSVTVWGGEDNVPPQYGKVFISIKPVSGFIITQTTKDLIISNILRQYNIVSVIPEIIDPDYIFIIVNCEVKYDPTKTFKTQGDIQTGAYNAIIGYATVNLDKFDLELRYSKLLAAIDGSDTSITNNLTVLQLKKIFAPNLQVVSNYSIKFNNPLAPGTLTSTSFVTVNDPQLKIPYTSGKTYQIMDDSNGNLTMVQQGIGIPSAVVRQCGTVNYETGDIEIQQIIPTTADGDGNISLIITPAVNDVIPVRNNILFIQPQDVFVSAIANPPRQG